ncbi:MAG TPA: NAD(P)-binding protein [Acidimicrobiales bacterium]|nr:NAD(P)-binding protein [Acidimicrobiales bacterium]
MFVRRRTVPAFPSDPRPSPLAAHALVVGAGPAGVAAAQALSRHVERVTIVERDDLPERPSGHVGVPLDPHAHLLRPADLAALERLVPGFRSELVAAGAVALRVPRGRRPAGGGEVLLSASGELVTCALRRRVFDSPQVLVREGLDVRGLAVDRGRVRGVEVRPRRAGEGGPTATIDADLVVDAGGRRSPATRWLVAAGLAAPAETVLDAGPAQASRLYRRAPGDAAAWGAAVVRPRPCGAVLAPVEDGRWLLTIVHAAGAVPVDDDGFAAFASSTGSPAVAGVLARAEALGPVVAFPPRQQRWRHHEAPAAAIDGFLAVGDALVAVEPPPGAGVAMVVQPADALDRAVAAHLARHRHLDGLSGGAQRAVAGAAGAFWRPSAGGPRDAGAAQMPRRCASSSRW